MLIKPLVQKLIFVFATTAFLFSCAKSEKNDLKDAQLCLNSASGSEALACVDQISSDTSPQAYKLRCSAVFIAEGFKSPTSFVSALDKINNNSGSCTGGCSSTVSAISSLSFSKSASDQTRSESVANTAFSHCSLAGTPIYMQISSIFKLGTMTANLAYQANGGTSTPNEDEIKAALSSLPPAEIGELTISTYNSTCQNTESSSDAIKKYCKELEAAVNSPTGTPASVGSCLINKLIDPSFICP